jgi:cytidyltransferase-like protein
MVKVYSFAVADLLHIGHLKSFQQAKALGDYLIVGILTDEANERYKRKSIIPFEQRLELVNQLKCVDMAVPQYDVDPTENLKIYQPDIVVHGDDWGNDFLGATYMRSIGKQAILTRYYPYQSTTMIIEDIVRRYKVNPDSLGKKTREE